MKKNLSDVDCIVLSHGHDDHTAGTVEIVKAAGGVKVYAHPHTFSPRFHEDRTGKRRQIGVPAGERMHEIEKAGGKVVLSSKPVEVVSEVWTTGQIGRATSFESPLPLAEGEKLIIIHDGKEMNDDILDDQAIWMKVDQVGPYVITGCAHAGTINTLLHVRKIGNFREIHGLVGGTHLVGRSDEYIEQSITQLKQFALRLISPCHCTGFRALARLWKEFPEVFVLNFSGRIIEASKEPKPRVI